VGTSRSARPRPRLARRLDDSAGLRVRCSGSLAVPGRPLAPVTRLHEPQRTAPEMGELQLKLQLEPGARHRAAPRADRGQPGMPSRRSALSRRLGSGRPAVTGGAPRRTTRLILELVGLGGPPARRVLEILLQAHRAGRDIHGWEIKLNCAGPCPPSGVSGTTKDRAGGHEEGHDQSPRATGSRDVAVKPAAEGCQIGAAESCAVLAVARSISSSSGSR
jgi:hypothetical protein